MNADLKTFREEHECKYCLYFRGRCKARDTCVFDYLPVESLEEDIELFLVV